MHRFFSSALIVLLFSTVLAAQIPTSGNVFVGYSYSRAQSVVSGFTNSANLNGWEGSLEGKVFPFVGIVADINGLYGSQEVTVACPPILNCGPTTVTVDAKLYSFLFGPRVSVSVGKFTPFAQALVGAAHVSNDQSLVGLSDSDTSFAYAVGGGIDYKLIPAVAWRFQGDLVQTRFFSDTQDNFRFSTGIVLRF